MTPKDKANELHDKYYKVFEDLGLDTLPNKYAKQCALLCVDDILNVIKTTSSLLRELFNEQQMNSIEFDEDYRWCKPRFSNNIYIEVSPEYWEQVKKEIKKL